MAALTQDQLVEIRRQIGTAPSDAELQTIYDRLGDIDGLVLEVLDIRYAEMVRNPASFNVPGEYGETRSAEQFKALEEARDRAASAAGVGSVRIVPPPDRKIR